MDGTRLDRVTDYLRHLPMPEAQAQVTPQHRRGETLFTSLSCAACHTPRHVTHRLAGRPEHSLRVIWPYTDLLLHDMGQGLADGRPEGRASGREWRTAPLWGLGQRVATGGLLHDGRAASVLEAVLWHDGEARQARDGVIALSPADRAALIAFLIGL